MNDQVEKTWETLATDDTHYRALVGERDLIEQPYLSQVFGIKVDNKAHEQNLNFTLEAIMAFAAGSLLITNENSPLLAEKVASMRVKWSDIASKDSRIIEVHDALNTAKVFDTSDDTQRKQKTSQLLFHIFSKIDYDQEYQAKELRSGTTWREKSKPKFTEKAKMIQ